MTREMYLVLSIAAIGTILLVGTNLPIIANASTYTAYQGVAKTSTVRGAEGKITITSTPALTSTANNHRDFMVFINLRNSQSYGSGAYAYKVGSIVSVSSAQYIYDTSGISHVINNIAVPINTQFTSSVAQTTQTGNCYQAKSYGSSNPLHTKCFASATYPINNVGNTAQTVPTNSGSSSNTAPAIFDFLKAGGWNPQGIFVFGDYFSSSTTVEYKCANLNGYHLDRQASYSGTGSQYDKVKTGPPSTVDDCATSNTAYSPYGE